MPSDRHDNFQPDGANSRNRTLPPIREVFADELSTPVGTGEGQRPHRSSISSGGQATFPSSAGYSDYLGNNSRRAPTTITAAQPRSYSSVGSAPSSPQYASHGDRGYGYRGEGYSYGVLRSGTSGVLTNAIPPSGRPQGILRQTSAFSDEPEDLAKRHRCDYCGKRFGMPSHLQIHLRTHTAERPFTCEFPGCHKTFTVRSNLSRHMRTHAKADFAKDEGENPFGGGYGYHGDPSQQSASSSDQSYYYSSRR
ncbi:hypothetical protein BU17DRAFT_96139 [Hysterangium stoloniferum]|nr:hypothetical protein BU17DRAFT_96139 [Hysterangium stoloniferum]